MAIQVVNIGDREARALLELEESHFLDFKAIDIKPGKLTEVISAFANADGGELYIGVDEVKAANKMVWRGFPTQEAANGHIQAFESLFPLGEDFDYTFLKCPKEPGFVLRLSISKTKDIKTASDGCVYIRRGAQKLPVKSHGDLKRLELSKGLSSFETEIVNVELDNIIDSDICKYFIRSVIPKTQSAAWMKKQQIVRGDKPTVAAVLLFADEPQALIPKHCGVKVYRYKSTDPEGSRDTLAFHPENVEGCLYNQIKNSVDRTIEVIEEIKKLGVKELESISYPRETLHEIITNAVIHRDYSIADDIHIRVFDNRIEVESPGRLPAHITPTNILSERFARNGTIVRLINKFPDPPNKDIGEGLNTAFSAMRKLRLKEPVIEQKDHSVLVRIRHEPLASPEEIILSYLEDHETVRNKTAREICGIGSENKVKNVFNRLIKAKKIERLPGTSYGTATYRKKRS